ncbi:MAG: LysR family transcriptional regulator [Clostridia bacterium]|nr:LysR family transcriptional regulator [Clostridia bacterium]
MLRYRIFLRIAETGNFTRAAEEFGYTQSAVSQIVRSLEEEWKMVLFTRTKRGTTLTADGKRVLPYVRKLCDDYAHLLEQSTAIRHLEGATVRIGAFASVSANFLPSIMKQFKEIYPTVQFKLLQGDYETIREWISDGRVDFGFLTKDVADKLQMLPIMKDEMVMILPKDHPLAGKTSLELGDFSREPFIFLDQGKKSEPMEYFSRAGISPNQQYRVYDDYTIMNMVEKGLGVSILPKLVLYRHHQDIVVRSLTPPVFREMCVAYKSDDSISVAGRTFMEFAVDCAGKGAY